MCRKLHIITGQDKFLYEHRHGRLLFDDNNFTRSRHYFWVINSVGEILPLEETIDHYEDVLKWPSTATGQLKMRMGDKYNEAWEELYATLDKLMALRERFERQRNRATALRDGVSPEPYPSLQLSH